MPRKNHSIEEPNPSGFCMCGCGQTTPIADQTRTDRGWIRGKPKRFIRGHAASKGLDRYTIEKRTGCWNWTGHVSIYGYGRVYNPETGTSGPAHRVIYENLRGPIPGNLPLDHMCRNRRCVNPDHLEPVTPAENTRRSEQAKLTIADVMHIRQLLKTHSMAEVARITGVGYANISTIAYGYTWKDVA